MTEVSKEAVGLRILRLLAVERGLQDEGQGNAARLFRAAALGEALRATRVHPRLGRGLEHAAREIITELRAAGNEQLAVLMDQALATVSSGGWPTLAQIAPTVVCRDCGEVMLGNPPDTCPVCRARALTFHELTDTMRTFAAHAHRGTLLTVDTLNARAYLEGPGRQERIEGRVDAPEFKATS